MRAMNYKKKPDLLSQIRLLLLGGTEHCRFKLQLVSNMDFKQ